MSSAAVEHFPLLARFNAWADARLYHAVAALPEAAYRLERGAFFGSIHRTLNHLLVVDRLWSDRLRGVEPRVQTLDQVLYDDFSCLRAAHVAENRELIALVDGLDKGRFAAPVRYRRIIGDGIEELRAGHVLLTLFNHQTHHRGQIHAMLTQAGITPEPLDVVFFLEAIGQCGPPGTLANGASRDAGPVARGSA